VNHLFKHPLSIDYWRLTCSRQPHESVERGERGRRCGNEGDWTSGFPQDVARALRKGGKSWRAIGRELRIRAPAAAGTRAGRAANYVVVSYLERDCEIAALIRVCFDPNVPTPLQNRDGATERPETVLLSGGVDSQPHRLPSRGSEAPPLL